MLSAYLIGREKETAKIWLVSTATVADPRLPKTLPIGSVVLSQDDARVLAEQILAEIPKARA